MLVADWKLSGSSIAWAPPRTLKNKQTIYRNSLEQKLEPGIVDYPRIAARDLRGGSDASRFFQPSENSSLDRPIVR